MSSNNTTDYYKLLGLPEDATTEDIKRAFRSKAFDHHPDQSGNETDRRHFQLILEAYECLRDPVKRKHYDDARNGILYPTDWDPSSSSPYNSDQAWENIFRDFTQRMKNDFDEYSADAERLRRERKHADRLAREQAWEREKKAAAANKERMQRVKYKAQQARYARHATVLGRFWQTHAGFTWQDAVVGMLFVGSTTLMAVYWKQYVERENRARCAVDDSSLDSNNSSTSSMTG